MNEYTPFIVIGLLNGSIYALAALGLTFTYRTTGVFNFGQGALGAGSAYFFYDLHTTRGIAWPLALAVTVLIFGIGVGLLLELLCRTRGMATVAMRIVATVAIMVTFQGLIVVRYGSAPISLIGAEIITPKQYTILSTVVTSTQIFVAAFVAVAAASLYLWVQHTKIGARSRAVVDNPELLAMSGVNPNGVQRWAWCVGCIFAVLAGVLATQVLGSLDSTLLTLLLLNAFAAVAIGRFRSLPLTYVGGIAVGLVAALTTKFVAPHPLLGGLPGAVPFLMLFIALLLLPPVRERALRQRASTATAIPTGSLRSKVMQLALGALILIVAPQLIDPTKLPGLTGAIVAAVLFLSLGLLVKLSGQVSLCHYTFAVIGAVTFSKLTVEHGVPWGLAVLLAGLVVVPIGAAIAIPAIRLSGLYLALATFGFGILVSNLFYTKSIMFGVEYYIPAPRPAGFTSSMQYYYLALVLVAMCAGLVIIIHRSRMGRLLRGMADSPIAVETNGTDLRVLKLIIFCASAFLAGTFGALIGPVSTSLTPAMFEPFLSLLLLALLAISGGGVIKYAFLGGIGLTLIPVFISNAAVANAMPVVFGLIAIAVVASSGPVSDLEHRLGRRKQAKRENGRNEAGQQDQHALVPETLERASLGATS